MPQEESAETTDKAIEEDIALNGVNDHADINEQEEVNEVEFTDTEETADEKEGLKSQSKENVKQANKVNSENARRRREEERQEELKKAREQAIIEVLNGKNPFTDEEIKDTDDIEEYLLMKQISDSGGDPLADYSKFQKQKLKKEKERQVEEQNRDEWFQKDRENFLTEYPDINVQELFSNKQFVLFADGKVGNIAMTKIYKDFLAVQQMYENQTKQKAARMVANAAASPGSLKSPNAVNDGYYTKEQVQAMSQDEVSKNYEKIRASMTKWKY